MPNGRTSKACSNCNQKKIRCIFSSSGTDACTSCAKLKVECVPRSRKKRRLARPSGELHSDNDHTASFPYWSPGQAQGPWDHGDSPLALHALPNQSLVTPTSSWTVNQANIGTSQGASFADSVFNCAAVTHQPSQVAAQRSDSSQLINTDVANQITSGVLRTFGTSTPPSQQETGAYVGRSHYIAQDNPIDESSARAYRTSKKKELSDTELKILELCNCLDLPPRAARQGLIDTFMKICYPWTPILDAFELQGHQEVPSSLLVAQAMFLAASRVSSAPGVLVYASSEQFYQRAKTLFWIGHERNPLSVITATIMLHWYNPDGPEHVSFDTSRFWLQIGVGLAHQVGLHREPQFGEDKTIRRRLWWSLVARDSLIAAGQGRPRAINLKDSDVQPPYLDDFPHSRNDGQIFIAYVEVCFLLGDLTECLSRKQMTRGKRQSLTTALFRWTRTLPDTLRLSQSLNGSKDYTLCPYNFNARQLHLPYFITLTVMARSGGTPGSVSPVTILASSFIAGIFEDFLARDELQYLGPIFTFYLLAASVALVSVRPHPHIWAVAQKDMEVLQNSLKELSKRWPSAIGALKAVHNVVDKQNPIRAPPTLEPLNSDQQLFFDGFCTDLCRLWIPYDEASKNSAGFNINLSQNGNPELMTAEILGNLRYPLSARPDHVLTPILPFSVPGIEVENQFQYDGVGNWLLADWGADMPW